MQNLICQHHWNRDFQDRDRWDAYGAKFGYSNRNCFFLLDHGETDDDSTVPILRYHWTGKYLYESLSREKKKQQKHDIANAGSFSIPIKGDIPPKMLEKLKNESSFTRPPFEKRIMDDATKCKYIQIDLRSEIGLNDEQIKYLKEHPQQTEWLKNNTESRFWKIVEKDERFASSSWIYQCPQIINGENCC